MQSILKKLISIDTTISINTTEAVDYIKDLLEQNGIASHLVYNKDKTRASLLATIGNPDNAGLILSGHLDTIAVEKDSWQHPPHQLTEENDCLFGRGTTDMKGAIACVLSNLDTLKNSGKTFHLVFTHDEEGGFTAINQLISSDFDNFFRTRPYACIVMEPSCLTPVGAHKGVLAYNVNITGKEAHSAYPELADDALKHAVQVYNKIHAAFDKQGFNGTTLNACQFNSGDALNKIPAQAFFSFVIRFQPQDNLDNFKLELEQICNDKRIELTQICSIPAFQTDDKSEFIKNFGDYEKVKYCTEAGFFQKYRIPTIIFGPGDIRQAHSVDEFIKKDQLERFSEFIQNIA